MRVQTEKEKRELSEPVYYEGAEGDRHSLKADWFELIIGNIHVGSQGCVRLKVYTEGAGNDFVRIIPSFRSNCNYAHLPPLTHNNQPSVNEIHISVNYIRVGILSRTLALYELRKVNA
jgi:hypothetical protein